MKVTILKPAPGEDEEIIVRAKQLDERVLELLLSLENEGKKLIGYHGDGSMSRLDLQEVYYFESVDNRVFAYGKSDVVELKYKLYELEERFRKTHFIRISKSMILNLSKVEKFKPSGGSRIEAVLENGEKAMISRQYVPDVRRRLGV